MKKINAEGEVRRTVEALGTCITRSQESREVIADRAGISVQDLSGILDGTRRLKVVELLSILDAIGKPQVEFYQELYGLCSRPTSSSGSGTN